MNTENNVIIDFFIILSLIVKNLFQKINCSPIKDFISLKKEVF